MALPPHLIDWIGNHDRGMKRVGLVALLVANTYYNNIFSNDAMLHQLMQTQIFLQRTPPSVHSPSHLPLCYCRFEIFFSFSPSYLNLFFRYHYNWRRLEKELKDTNGLNATFIIHVKYASTHMMGPCTLLINSTAQSYN